jgi:hypothetical protein
LYPKVVFLLFNPDPQRLSVGNELRSVDLAAGDHVEIAFDAGPDGSFRVPIYSKREAFP